MSARKILIISDAWLPQINGVVRTLEATAAVLRQQGHAVTVAGPETSRWSTIAAPSYPSIKLEFFARRRLARLVSGCQPDFIHIATEGPLGWAARNLCLRLGRPFTTSYHTRFPEYLAARVPRFLSRPILILAYAVLRRFHAPSSAIMVATPTIQQELQRRKFRRLARWVRGVDTEVFRPYGKDLETYAHLTRPVLLYVGRVAVEKNLHAFLSVRSEGSRVVIGDGPDMESLKRLYPSAHFIGAMQGEKLARHYAAADVFVFPSTTDTFGLVLLEACACGLRVASVPAPGPVDIFSDPQTGNFAVLNDSLEQAVHDVLKLTDDPLLPRRFAETFSWEACTRQFFDHLQASTPVAVKRMTRLRNWLSRWWQHALALRVK